MSADAVAQLQKLVRSDVVRSRFVGGGYTPTSRWIVQLDDGRSVFVKHAVHDSVVARLRVEYEVYRQLRGAWLPQMIAYQDGQHPMLVLEDLSGCDWPPPWDGDRVAAVRRALDDVASHPVPAGLRPIAESGYAAGGWPKVAEDPEPFLGLRLCSRRWLDAALPSLLDAADVALLDGDQLCHLDVRSDNLCFRADSQAVLIDWDCAAVGNPEFDVAFWLPSLHLEGGPAPESVMAVTPGIVAIVAGFFASEAGLPQIPHAPGVRGIQSRQLQVALPWAAHALELEPPVSAQ